MKKVPDPSESLIFFEFVPCDVSLRKVQAEMRQCGFTNCRSRKSSMIDGFYTIEANGTNAIAKKYLLLQWERRRGAYAS